MDQSVSFVLETARLRLREFTLADADALEQVIGDPLAMRYYASAFDRSGVEAWIARNRERYSCEGHGLWAMALKESNEMIGDCGCVLQQVEERPEVEIAYHVRRDLWCKGYATEAARACMEYAFAKIGARLVISMIRPENIPSRRVAEKNGLVCEKIVFWHGYDHCIYVRSKN